MRSSVGTILAVLAVLADNGSNWSVSGESDNGWEPEMDALLSSLGQVKGSDFEIVKTGSLVIPPK